MSVPFIVLDPDCLHLIVFKELTIYAPEKRVRHSELPPTMWPLPLFLRCKNCRSKSSFSETVVCLFELDHKRFSFYCIVSAVCARSG